MAKPKPYYKVLFRGDDSGTHYVFATTRKFWRYSEAELYSLSFAITRKPIILMVG
ncbi:hypothetical protein [Bradyrhizobium erythrophlei]|uniref:Uncharacterized protein n=1 Tax=Bradyrhizobium erythrophlei TaxID=1437360 RepID=A0A1M5NHD0_9BRAD|nr:hypothetical protein [Bradyrhizobium erythrophlei]SHG88845.1 hypothetical protein SAMN05443248_2995 [Bradyrhizobium erythrophlei]